MTAEEDRYLVSTAPLNTACGAELGVGTVLRREEQLCP